MSSINLNLGCGDTVAPGEFGVDIRPTPAVSVVADIGGSLPFRSDSVDSVTSIHCLEHMKDVVAVIEEIYRVLKPNGILNVAVPHVSNIGFFRDPTHYRPFTLGTFDYFVRGAKPVDYTPVEFEYVDRRLVFGRGLRGSIGKMLYKLSPRRYEKYSAWKYPCYEIRVTLRALK